jgi:hypothetical protein
VGCEECIRQLICIDRYYKQWGYKMGIRPDVNKNADLTVQSRWRERVEYE